MKILRVPRIVKAPHPHALPPHPKIIFVVEVRDIGIKWLRQKTHDREVMGSNLCSGDHFWIKSMEEKNVGKLTWHCSGCCNPKNRTVDLYNPPS